MNPRPSLPPIPALMLALPFLLPPQAALPDTLRLDLGNPDTRIENVIALTIPPNQYERLQNERGEKFALTETTLTGNGRTVTPKSIKLRGQTTLHLMRKSLNVSLNDPVVIHRGDASREMERFYLVSLSMDRHYMRNLIAFTCLNRLGLFSLFHTLTEVRINDESQGVYLLIQRPKDFAFDDRDTPYLARRTYEGKIEETDFKGGRTPLKQSAYDRTFRRLYRMDRDAEGRALADALDAHLDLGGYMRWLAFNYFIQNGDYADEVYLYAEPDTTQVRFHIIPWDYDDILSPTPHEGWQQRNKILGEKRLFSSEDPLDRIIADDPYLYDRYEEELHAVLEHLNPRTLADVFEAVYGELYPYYRDADLIGMSRHDRYGETNLALFQAALREAYAFLVMRRQAVLAQ